jgi:hypothetical protein
VVAGFSHPQCTRCSELLLAYITAGNDWVDARERLDPRRPPTRALRLALDEARERRRVLGDRLANHQQIHHTFTRDLTHS